MYLWVQSLFSFFTHFACWPLSMTPGYLSSEPCPQHVLIFNVFVYTMDFKLFSFLNCAPPDTQSSAAEEVEVENTVPMRSLPTKHHACRWPAPSSPCLGADGASKGTGPVQGKDTTPAQLWWGRGGQGHIPPREGEKMIIVCGLLHFWLLWCCSSFIPNVLVFSLFFLTPPKWELTFLFSPF